MNYLCCVNFYKYMKDSKNDSTAVLTRFGRDKRKRTVTATAERVERRPRVQNDAADAEHSASERPRRASYNPNFTEDNRPAFDKPHRTFGERPAYDRKPYGERREEGGNRYGDKPRYGEDRPRRQFGDKPAYDRKPYGERREEGGNRYGDKPRYGEDRPRRQFGDKPAYDRKPYGERREESGNRYGDKPRYGEDRPRRQFGDKPGYDRKPYGERRDDNNRFGDKPAGKGNFGGKNFGDKRYGDRKFGDKKFGGKSGYARRDDKPVSYPKFSPEKQTGEMRLNRFIAQSGICSRREADDFITAGLVSVNGVIVTELGTKVMPTDEVKFNDSRVQGEKKVYLVLNKPKGYVTSLDDPHAGKTVMELVQGACTERIYPVGRLDKNSLGLLLFTNDGDMTRQLTHPSYKKKKIYQVTLDKPLTRADMDRIAEGITLEDGEIFADEISYIKENKQEVGIEIHSGRNRIVRRIFEFLGYTVTKLDRVYYAGLTKKNLKRGAWRFLSREEVERLRSGMYE